MVRSLDDDAIRGLTESLRKANLTTTENYPGDGGKRQPVHTVYGGAHLFKSDTTSRLGALAIKSLELFAPDAFTFARAIGLVDERAFENETSKPLEVSTSLGGGAEDDRRTSPQAWLANSIYKRVLEKLRREPVEDFRIDFEDGYGNRPDAEEDGHAESAALEVARGLNQGTLPPFIGIRIKPFTEELRARSMRTLDIFVSTLANALGGKLPADFYVTLPKITIPEQVSALADLFELLEQKLGLTAGTLRLELMIETTQAIIGSDGRSNLSSLYRAARGRCTAAHFGTYDYTAACNITAAHQHMLHPACDFARNMMQVALGGTGVWLSDGATNIMPVAPHRAAEGETLTNSQIEENRNSVWRAWELHYEHIQHSLTNAFYQGWDLHPAQLPTRYAAVYSFFLESLDAASERLRNFVEKAAKATLVGDVFDDAATGQGLLNYFLRAINCGALTEEEGIKLSGLSLAELRSGSFVKILNGRQSN